MVPLAQPERQADALILLRALYEHVVTFLWLAIDPEERVTAWYEDALRHRRTLHLEAIPYGATDVLTEVQLRAAEEAEKLKPLQQRAREADRYWPSRIVGFHTDPEHGNRNVLTLDGLYTGIYRLASRDAHATLESVDPWLDALPRGRYRVRRVAKAQPLTWSTLALPLLSMALVVAHHRLGWPDEARVRAINDALMLDRTL